MIASANFCKFLSTLSLRRATYINGRADNIKRFLSTLSLRRATKFKLNFINQEEFLSTLSLRRATPVREIIQWEGIFLSTLSLRRATVTSVARVATTVISIHALLAESDPRTGLTCGDGRNISIHALLAESDFVLWTALNLLLRFLSTLSLRRATDYNKSMLLHLKYFYPRSPCGERLGKCRCWVLSDIISIHALLAESDRRRGVLCYLDNIISIHALLAESDGCFGRFAVDPAYFYPRSPCGERQARRDSRQQPAGISIHALLAESDAQTARNTSIAGHFYPRSPCGERRRSKTDDRHKTNFYPRSPCGERRWLRCWQLAARDISIHALLAESDRTL